MSRLVLLPGLGCDRRVWSAQMPVLPTTFDVHVSDVHTRHSSIAAMADAVLRENTGQLVLCGTSMGGMIAMEAARRAPHRIAGLALLGTSARPESPDMREMRAAAIELFEHGDPREMVEPNAAFAFHPAQAGNPALVARYVEIVLDAGAAQLVRQNRALMQRPDARAHLPALRCPVLVLCGDADRVTPPECSREIAALVPQAELAWMPDCGHMLTLEKPRLVNEALKKWLRQFTVRGL